jgi:hypothetical protein
MPTFDELLGVGGGDSTWVSCSETESKGSKRKPSKPGLSGMRIEEGAE